MEEGSGYPQANAVRLKSLPAEERTFTDPDQPQPWTFRLAPLRRLAYDKAIEESFELNEEYVVSRRQKDGGWRPNKQFPAHGGEIMEFSFADLQYVTRMQAMQRRAGAEEVPLREFLILADAYGNAWPEIKAFADELQQKMFSGNSEAPPPQDASAAPSNGGADTPNIATETTNTCEPLPEGSWPSAAASE